VWGATLLAVAVAVSAALSLELRAARTTAASARRIPQGLPGYFGFGVMNGPGGVAALDAMRSANGTAWDFRYQYLSGGVNTGRGWETWNAPPGTFATSYMRESGRDGYIPVFVYYDLLQSIGSCKTCAEPRRDLSNLDNPTVMSAYYGNWKLLMRKLGAYGRPVLVIVEPDLWGYIEQGAIAHGNSAAGIAASVGSSGDVDAAGLPDNAQGFAWALLRMRDRYARNAVLALHASPWATGVDISSSTGRSLDAAGLGAREAKFLESAGLAGSPAGISTFDLVSSDVANRDSAQSGIWWDPDNVRFPNFARYLRFVAALSDGTSRRVLMWQVPAGNQYFDTENNRPGHTQDNRAAYILQNIPALVRAGIVGVLFGPGKSGTMVDDARRDGTTNPAPVRSYKCGFCNVHVSRYPDDDGGYLRIRVGRYYRSGAHRLKRSMPVATAPSRRGCAPKIAFGAVRASPVSVGAGEALTFAISLRASCAARALVDFEVYDAAGRRVWQSWKDRAVLTARLESFRARWVVPRELAAGPYTLKLGVFSVGWGRIYGWNDGARSFLVTGTTAACRSAPRISFGNGSASPAVLRPGAAVTFAASLRASCPVLALVDFQVHDIAGKLVWQSWHDRVVLTRTAKAFAVSWKLPEHMTAGTYTLKLGVFGTGWKPRYGWNDRVATIRIGR
jgi:hypothetical protein